jgi:RNA polymerase sigma factor (sigma-70 family)
MPEARPSSVSGFGVRQPSGALARNTPDLRPSNAAQHGGNLAGEELHESRIAMAVPSEELLAVNDALETLALEDPQAAEVVRMRYFVGMTVPEIADALELAPRTVDRHWAFARAWLKRAIRTTLSGPASHEGHHP